MKKGLSIMSILFYLTLFLLPLPSSAIMVGLSTEELTLSSDAVIMGEVESVESRWDKEGKTIFTRAIIEVTETIKGKTKSKFIRVNYEGGEVGDIGLMVSDVAPLKKGERVLLFLQADKQEKVDDLYTITGKAQGKYTVHEDGTARKGGFSIVDGQELIDEALPVEKLIEKIKGAK